MRKLAIIIALGALIGVIPAHASAPVEFRCLGQGGIGYPAFQNDWYIQSGVHAPSLIIPGCAVTSDDAQPPSPPPADPGAVWWADGLVPGGSVSLAPDAWTFACGDGEMSGGGWWSGVLSTNNSFGNQSYRLGPWTASFSGGQGHFTGTATPWNGGAERQVEGTIDILDGGATPACNDTWPNATVLIDLTMS